MLKLIHIVGMLIMASMVPAAFATTHKCSDGKKITYANIPCGELGLTSIGPVRTVVTVIPSTRLLHDTSEATEEGKETRKSVISGNDHTTDERVSGEADPKPHGSAD